MKRFKIYYRNSQRQLCTFECNAEDAEQAKSRLKRERDFQAFLKNGIHEINETGAIIG